MVAKIFMNKEGTGHGEIATELWNDVLANHKGATPAPRAVGESDGPGRQAVRFTDEALVSAMCPKVMLEWWTGEKSCPRLVRFK